MGDKNQALYLSKYVPECEGRILEIGSKDYGNTASFRDHYDYEEYVGIDMEDGDGVDAVVDLVAGTGSLEKNYFDLAICCSVIEHVNRPWIFADNLSSLIKPGGLLYISAPWVWRYHPYPDDYWRFSWRGVEQLFPDFDWDHKFFSTNVIGEIFPAAHGSDDKAHILKDIGQDRVRKYLPYLNINMIGRKIAA